MSTRGAVRGRRTLHDLVVTRPSERDDKKGTTGKQVSLMANYFRIRTLPKWTIHQYHVDFSPAIDLTTTRKYLMRQHKKLFNGFIFDGSILLTSTYSQNGWELISKRDTDGETYKITVKYIKEVKMTDEMSLMVLNNILRRAMEALKLQLVGRNFFDAVAKIPIREYRLELWPGYVTSIRQHEQDILMCAEISTKVMRQETLHDILQVCMRDRDYRDMFSRMVMGSIVLTDYSNKTYRVDEVDWESNPNSTFDTKNKNGETVKMSFCEYYETRYSIKIRDKKQPLLKSKSTDRKIRAGESQVIALIPELCRATGLTDEMRANFRLMKAVADHTRVGPDQRVRRLLDFNRRLQNTPGSTEIIQEWNMTLEKDLVTLTGRELDPETIVFSTGDARGTQEGDWTRDLRGQKFYTAIELRNWVCITPRRASREASDFIKVLQDAVRNMGMRIHQPETITIDSDRSEDIIRGIESGIRKDPQLIMVVVTNNNAARYAAIKKKCCVDRAIPTQVMVLRTITPKDGNVRSLMSVGTKVGIQLNCKLGAAPWFIKLPLSGLMVCGFDVTHDAKDKSRSYGALVCSMDQRQSCRYFSAVSAHRNGEELSNELSLNMHKAIREYREEHKCLPSKILFYRDGVGEGQLSYCYEYEVKNLKDALNRVYQDAGETLRLAFVIVNKRINTRLFKNGRNPVPGTIVDDIITLPERYDFYLVPQNVRQGTVSPTCFSIIEDSLLLPPDKLQQLTYKMCHLYYNWSGTVRVPAVCQYAHKLAFLVGQHLHTSPSHALGNKLYFL